MKGEDNSSIVEEWSEIYSMLLKNFPEGVPQNLVEMLISDVSCEVKSGLTAMDTAPEQLACFLEIRCEQIHLSKNVSWKGQLVQLEEILEYVSRSPFWQHLYKLGAFESMKSILIKLKIFHELKRQFPDYFKRELKYLVMKLGKSFISKALINELKDAIEGVSSESDNGASVEQGESNTLGNTTQDQGGKMSHKQLQCLIVDSFNHSRRLRRTHPNLALRHSFPVLWFGDLEKWRISPYKIITVGINPGPRTFMPDTSRHRYQDWWRQILPSQPPTFHDYNGAMRAFMKQVAGGRRTTNAGGKSANDSTWFKTYQPITETITSGGLSATIHSPYYLHTDIFSPIATDQAWSQLTNNQQSLLSQHGIEYWKRLMSILQPDGIILSVSRHQWASLQGVLHLSQPIQVWSNLAGDRQMFHACADTTQWGEHAYDKRFWVCYGTKSMSDPFSPFSNLEKTQAAQAFERFKNQHQC